MCLAFQNVFLFVNPTNHRVFSMVSQIEKLSRLNDRKPETILFKAHVNKWKKLSQTTKGNSPNQNSINSIWIISDWIDWIVLNWSTWLDWWNSIRTDSIQSKFNEQFKSEWFQIELIELIRIQPIQSIHSEIIQIELIELIELIGLINFCFLSLFLFISFLLKRKEMNQHKKGNTVDQFNQFEVFSHQFNLKSFSLHVGWIDWIDGIDRNWSTVHQFNQIQKKQSMTNTRIISDWFQSELTSELIELIETDPKVDQRGSPDSINSINSIWIISDWIDWIDWIDRIDQKLINSINSINSINLNYFRLNSDWIDWIDQNWSKVQSVYINSINSIWIISDCIDCIDWIDPPFFIYFLFIYFVLKRKEMGQQTERKQKQSWSNQSIQSIQSEINLK